MNLADYFAQDPARRKQLAEAIGANHDYLWQIATGWKERRASHELAKRIEAATDGVVTRYDLRPDIFGEAPAAQTQNEAA